MLSLFFQGYKGMLLPVCPILIVIISRIFNIGWVLGLHRELSVIVTLKPFHLAPFQFNRVLLVKHACFQFHVCMAPQMCFPGIFMIKT